MNRTDSSLTTGVFKSAGAILVPIVVLITVVVRLLRNKYRRGLSTIPGPPLAAYTSLWRLYDVWKGSAHMTAIELHRRHGPLVRIGPNHVSVADPREISNIYGLAKGYTKTAFYPLQSISWNKQAQNNLFSTRDEQYHREQKRLVANAYSMTSILAREDAVDSCIKLFISQLSRLAEAGRTVDLGAWLQWYAFDVVGELSFASKLGFLQRGADVDGMIASIGGILNYVSLCGQVPEAHPFLLGNPLFPILLPAMETWNQVLVFTLKCVNSALGGGVGGKDNNSNSNNNNNNEAILKRNGELAAAATETRSGTDMLSRWTAARLSTRDMVVHLSANVFAGSDTTAIALRATIYFLLKNPATLRRLEAEIDAADRAGLLGDPVRYRDTAAHLPYLDAVVKEAMRLHPSVGLLLERHVPEGGAVICGRRIPGGTVVGVNAWVSQRDPDVFDDPESFVPERWLNSTPEKLRRMQQAYLVWGAGPRSCVGKHMATLEIMKVIPQLFREFRVELADPEAEWKTRNVWFVQQEGLLCKLVRRR